MIANNEMEWLETCYIYIDIVVTSYSILNHEILLSVGIYKNQLAIFRLTGGELKSDR